MKKVILALSALALVSTSAFAQKLKGSDTVLPLSQKAAELYSKQNPTSNVTVTGGGSGVGISALMDGTTDVAMASRRIKIDERMKLQEAGKTVVEKIVAWDALAVVVNPKNQISQLTRQQLEDIFTGKVTNWKQVGGADLKIVVYSRETSSGTYEFFKESILKNKNYMSAVLSMPATGAIIQSVSQTPGAIGYVGHAYVNKDVKALKVSYDGKTFIEPTYANAKNKSYPVVRPLYYYYTKDKEKSVDPFVKFILSADGQKLVQSVGYIDIL